MVVLVLASLGGATLAACGSVPDLTFEPADGGGSTEAGSSSGSSSGGACTPTGPEICDDGIDNDCNGKTDCADTACGAYACTPTAPQDWQLVAYQDSTTRTACPPGFGTSTDLKSALSGPGATCNCSCSAVGSCSAGTFSLTHEAACGTTDTLGVHSTCEKLNGAASIPVAAATKLLPPASPTCSASPTATVPPLNEARICGKPPRVGGGCPGGQVCAPKPTAGYAICVAKSGSSACPVGFDKAHAAGTTPTDTRACTACTCNLTPCSGQAKLYADPNCTGTPDLTLNASAAATCVNTAANFTVRSYTSTVTGGCAVGTPSQVTGGVTFPDVQTICCN